MQPLRPLLIALTALGLAAAPARADDPVDWATRVPNLFHDAGVSAGAVAVLRGGVHTTTVVYGPRDHDGDEPLAADSIHVAAALSAPVFAHLALQLSDEGLLDLDAPLADSWPNPRLADEPAAARITPRMLLAHSAGLPNWGDARLQLIDEPGRAWHYSGEGYLWLQQALEGLTGQPLDTLARARVFEPLGMPDSGYVWREAFLDRMVSGRSSFGQIRPVGRIGTANAAGSLLTTITDMARFVEASLSGAGLAPDTRDTWITPQVALDGAEFADAPVALSWGLGWGLSDGEGGRALWHWGDAGDFSAWVLAWTDSGDGLVLLSNDADGLAIAGSLGRWLRDVPQVTPELLGYEAWDDVDRGLRQRLLASFRRSVAAGRRKWDELADEFSPDARLEQLRRAGYTLLFEGADDEALELFRIAVAAHADEPLAHESLAEAASRVRDWETATEAFEQALALQDDPLRRRRLAWVRAERDAPARPAPVDPALAARLVGRYGEHVIDAGADGGLTWSRPGVDPLPLIPLGDGVFRIVGLDGLHLRFVLAGPGPARAMRAISGSGRVDERARSP